MSENTSSFYDRLSGDYDEMTRFNSRLETQIEILRPWVERYQIRSAIDVGCGTGLHSLALCQLGIQVHGVDSNAKMLAQAKEHSERLECPVEWHHLDMLELDRLSVRADALFCLGNTIPHILNENELHQSVYAMNRVLETRGIVLLQQLNYNRILRDRDRIVGIQKKHQGEIIRFYDFIFPLIRFNVLKIEWQESKPQHDLYSTLLKPYKNDELISAFNRNGFQDPELYGSLQGDPYDVESRDLVLLARKSGSSKS
jgi:ubiquinone/menaquinone biosynthesis C-methylase UbiE